MDACFGRFITSLKDAGLYDDSIVVLTADHGDALGEAKRWGHAYTLFPEIVRVPLLMHIPSKLRARFTTDVDAASYSTDITPSLYALLGYYSFDAGANFVQGTWDAIKSSYEVALTAAALVNGGERSAFALCRPPGHHAGAGFMGGYCYINNAAVAAQWFRDHGAKKVSILDVDYHHGNGTQEIFYERGDVQVLNLHADPMSEYPFFLGHADERGSGAGEGFNINYPMPAGTGWEKWNASLEDACARLAAYGPDVVVVSLGVDTFEKDPISQFKLKTEDFPKIGARIARLGLPTLFVMEGGYAVAEIAVNAVGVLTGFEQV
jgi:acetoin utilization deacetylase AcuC-like enzyme